MWKTTFIIAFSLLLEDAGSDYLLSNSHLPFYFVSSNFMSIVILLKIFSFKQIDDQNKPTRRQSQLNIIFDDFILMSFSERNLEDIMNTTRDKLQVYSQQSLQPTYSWTCLILDQGQKRLVVVIVTGLPGIQNQGQKDRQIDRKIER